mgnify:CR=1 FL=1
MDRVSEIMEEQKRSDLPEFRAGDRVKVNVRVIEGDKERIQPFEGDVIAIKGKGYTKTFTVRKVTSGVGVERIFPFNSTKIAGIELMKQGKVRRAKLYFLRELSGKAARIKSKNTRQ